MDKGQKTSSKIVFSVGMIFFVALFTFSFLHLVEYWNDGQHIEEITNEVADAVFSEDPEEEPKIEEAKYINEDIMGWIRVEGTSINYPFVQTKDNDYYLTHSIDNSYSQAGWIFADYRNSLSDLDKNTILYAHGRYDGTMFGTLKNTLNDDWLHDKSKHYIELSTDSGSTRWEVFSVYIIPTTSDYLQIDFNNIFEFGDFLDVLTERSAFKFDTQVESTDKILTLSTCYNEDEKVVMHAKLVR